MVLVLMGFEVMIRDSEKFIKIIVIVLRYSNLVRLLFKQPT